MKSFTSIWDKIENRALRLDSADLASYQSQSREAKHSDSIRLQEDSQKI